MVSIAVAEAAIRPTVNVYDVEGKVASELPLPAVFRAAPRSDIVHFIHTQVAKNARQAYGVKIDAGEESPAISWGPGRAVARAPRVPGSGTRRSGQAAIVNFARGGRMFCPNRTMRKWNRKANVNMKRYAVASALAASAVPAFLMARGHRVAAVPEIPLVVSNSVEEFKKTREAVALLEKLGAYADVEKCIASKTIRAGKGKMRNRRTKMRRGPLVVFNEDNGVHGAFRNIAGVDVAQVDSLNILDLAPGGHLGRFVIFTEGAFAKLDAIWGSVEKAAELKKGYQLPTAVASTGDFLRIINSDEVQAVIRARKNIKKSHGVRRNPLRNKEAMKRLNPYTKVN